MCAATVTTLAGPATVSSGNADNAVGASAKFNKPRGLALSTSGAALYVADSGNNQIRAVSIATSTLVVVLLFVFLSTQHDFMAFVLQRA